MRRLILSSALGGFLLSGCTNDQAFTTPPAAGVARSQKADTPAPAARPTSFLDALPEQAGDATSGEVAARIRATVNGVPIFDEEVKANGYQFFMLIRDMPEPDHTRKYNELYREILNTLIDRELLIQDAQARLKKAGSQVMKKLEDAAEKEFDKKWVRSMKKNNPNIKTDDDLKDFLRHQGLSFDMIRRQWIRQFIASEYLRNRVIDQLGKIGHEEMVEYYEQHIKEFMLEDTVEWEDMFISAAAGKYASREEAHRVAEQLKARLIQGDDFKTLCKEYDDGLTSKTNGQGVGKKRGEIQPRDCEPHLFSMQPGDIGPIIELPGGFHVFQLVTRTYAGRKPFDPEVQKEIRNKLRGEMYEREAKKISADLKRRAIIDYAKGS
jgi:hypothetical protein